MLNVSCAHTGDLAKACENFLAALSLSPSYEKAKSWLAKVRGEQSASTAATAAAATADIQSANSANNALNVTGSSKLTQPSPQKAKSSTAEVTSELSKARYDSKIDPLPSQPWLPIQKVV